MLESCQTGKFEYQKLSLEEQQKRGILGRLVGVIADTVNPTRNGRKYSDTLWEKVFEDPLMQEKINNRCLFGELGHPADREETDMEKIALCLAEKPKKGKDGKLYGVFDILSTPNGRILKTLCDYGCNIGISSRGSGDLYTDMDGQESVDEDTYDCQGFDAVLVPAVKEARLAYVTESLDKVKYNKTLRARLQESLEKASEEDKKVMQESLDTLGVILNEDDLHKVFKKDAKDQYKNFSAKKAKYDAQADKLKKDLKDLGETDPEKINYYKDIIIGDEPVFKYRKGHNSLERQNYPFYVTVYEGTSYFHPEEGGYYQAGLEPVYSEGYQSFEEAQSALQDYLKENGSTTVSFNPSNLPADDDNYSYAESEEEYKPLYDSKDRLIGAIASGKYIGEEEQVWVESNKQYLKRQVGYRPYESLENNSAKENLTESAESIRNSMQKLHDYLVQWYDENIAPETAGNVQKAGWDEELDQAWLMLVNLALPDDIDESLNEEILEYDDISVENFKDLFDVASPQDCANSFNKPVKYKGKVYYPNIKKKDGNVAVDNNEAMVEELQKSLKQTKELQNKLVGLQEKLSVSYAKESKLQEDLYKQKSAVSKLTRNSAQLQALKQKLKTLEDNEKLLESKLKTSQEANKKLRESIKENTESKKSLQEKLVSKDKSAQKLTEELSKVRVENKKLEEQLADIKQDSEIKKNDYSKKLEESNKLVEKYKRIAAKSVDKYIDLQATKLGITTNEIKNRLPESYNFKDIDEACDSLKQYRMNLNKLPFNTMFNEELKIKATPSKKDKLVDFNNSMYDDDVDEQLLNWVK